VAFPIPGKIGMISITVASPYATALFKVAEETGVVKGCHQALATLATIAGTSDFIAFSSNPTTAPSDVIRLFDALLKEPLSEDMKRLITLLMEHKRLFLLPDIALLFEEKMREKEKRLHVLLASAYPLDKRLLDKIATWLQKKYNRTIELEARIDADLIGGARIQVGDEVMDLSIKNSVEQAYHALAGS
jgi:F-type H+-transporting ATPase subunit delta